MDWGVLVVAYVVVTAAFGSGFVAGALWKAAHSESESSRE